MLHILSHGIATLTRLHPINRGCTQVIAICLAGVAPRLSQCKSQRLHPVHRHVYFTGVAHSSLQCKSLGLRPS